MNTHFNQQMQQQQQQQLIQQNGNAGINSGGSVQNPGTPGGYQSTGNYSSPSPMQPGQQIGNPRTPGGGMPMQNMGYGQQMTPQSNYTHSQQNSPAPSGQPQSTGVMGGELVTLNNQNQMATGTLPQNQQQQPIPQKEFNAASFCRLGQETVQEFVNKIHELFGCLKATQPPDGKFQAGIDRKQKLHEMLRAVKGLLKRLRIIYDKVEEVFPSSDSWEVDVQNLIPYENAEEGKVKDEGDASLDESKNTETYRLAMEEYREVAEQVVVKNRHLKETIDHLRQIIWDINTMLAMRKD